MGKTASHVKLQSQVRMHYTWESKDHSTHVLMWEEKNRFVPGLKHDRVQEQQLREQAGSHRLAVHQGGCAGAVPDSDRGVWGLWLG